MEFQIWWLWMGLAAVFVIGELFTQGFFLLWFGVGAFLSGILALLGVSPAWQWAVFVVVSGALFMVSRRFAERFSAKQPPGIGADRLIGKRGVVLENIDNELNTGKVRIDREQWRADSELDDNIPSGRRIEVVRLEGTHVVVRALKED
ncbi:MAG: NfeD family protein [Candidatus Eisenbacteria bacterium]|nr:NfeD family protein [Candidatus Eisenbacteria bacterium]